MAQQMEVLLTSCTPGNSGAATDINVSPEVVIDGYWMGLAKTSITVS
jgi:hypothetical protein